MKLRCARIDARKLRNVSRSGSARRAATTTSSHDATGDPLTERLIYLAQLAIEERANVPHRRIRDARHAAATFALSAGVDVKRVQAMLGHATAAFTLDRYAHVLPNSEADAAARVASLPDGSVQIVS